MCSANLPLKPPATSPSLVPDPGGDEAAADATPTINSSRIIVGFVGAYVLHFSLGRYVM